MRWVRSALADDQVQIALANLAASRASNQQVRSGATGFVSTYTASQQALQQDAQSLGISYTSTLSGANQAMVRRLTNLSGASFDRAYAAQLTPDENVALAAARREGVSQNRLLQADANSNVASLQSDLLTSRAISNSVRGVVGNSNASTGTTSTVGGITTTTSANHFGATATIGNGASALTISPINVGFGHRRRHRRHCRDGRYVQHHHQRERNR